MSTGTTRVFTPRNFLIKAAVIGGAAVAGGTIGAGGGTAASTVAAPSVAASTAAPLAKTALTVAATGSSIPWKSIISTGGQLVQNYLGQKADDKAIAAQTAANDKAQQQQQQYRGDMLNRIATTENTQRQLYSPYLNLGAGAASTLASRMGLPTGPAPGTGPGNVGTVPYSPNTQLTPVNPGNAQGIVTNPQGPPLSAPQAPPGTLGSLGQGTLTPTSPGITPQAQAQAQTQSGYVTMQAPDGTTAQVDAAHAPYWLRRGAQVVQQGAA